MRPRLPATASFLLSSACAFGLVVACSGGDARPPSTTGLSEGGADFDASPITDAMREADAPTTCTNTTKDANETDVDCGGACAPCALGKACVQDKDCSDDAKCTNKICAKCDDGVTNGDETDVDCGGKACGPCTVGKRCKAGPDCKTASCAGDACACPAGMAIIALAGGGAYCIDQFEVTKGQYNKFITANVPVNDQIAICKPPANVTFVPRGAWPPATNPGPLEFNFALPVHYVDWCDAYAYCKWAKKELCGKIGGGAIAPAEGADPTKSAWYNACSAQGTKGFPYGTTFDGTKCNGAGKPAGDAEGVASSYGYTGNQDDDVYAVAQSDAAGNAGAPLNAACQGGSVGLYQMSGNLAEWEDSCDGNATVATCRVRGGSYAAENDEASLACAAVRSVPRLPPAGGADPLKDIGFRCCVY